MLRRSFEGVSPDLRVQAIIIAFCFGALLEALAGFGTPVAISAVMLIALGFPAAQAATVALIANTAPVAFGALAIPIVTLADITSGRQQRPAAHGRHAGLDGRSADSDPRGLRPARARRRRGRPTRLRQAWLPAVVAGLTFGIVQFLASNYISVPLDRHLRLAALDGRGRDPGPRLVAGGVA